MDVMQGTARERHREQAAEAMDIYVALRDSDQPQSFVIGAFSSEAKARAACQNEADGIAEGWGTQPGPLAWEDSRSSTAWGDQFDVVLVSLDVAID